MASLEETQAQLESTRVIEEGDCPCGGQWGRGETQSGWLVVSHTMPACALYMENAAPDYLLALRQQKGLDHG